MPDAPPGSAPPRQTSRHARLRPPLIWSLYLVLGTAFAATGVFDFLMRNDLLAFLFDRGENGAWRMTRRQRVNVVLHLVLTGGLGAVLLAAAVAFAGVLIDFQTHAVRVTGVITGNHSGTCSHREELGNERYRIVSYTCHMPIATYVWEGVTREYRMSERLTGESRLGERVELLVDPRTTPDAQSFHQDPSLGWILVALLAAAGVYALRQCVRMSENPDLIYPRGRREPSA